MRLLCALLVVVIALMLLFMPEPSVIVLPCPNGPTLSIPLSPVDPSQFWSRVPPLKRA